MKIFDGNTHIEKEHISIRLREISKWQGGETEGTLTHYATVSDIVGGMKKQGIKKALIMPNTITTDKGEAKKASDVVAKELKGYKELCGAACIHPFSNSAIYDLEECILEKKLNALMLSPDRQGFEINDEAVWILMEKVEEMSIPVIFDTQWSKKTQTYFNMENLYDLGSSFRINLILTHMGIGSGVSELSELADLDNIYLETSHSQPKDMLRVIEIFGSKRLIFGSDFSYNLYPKHELEKILAMEIDKSDKERILCTNMEKLLK